jgi:hypothetical protein
VSTKDSAFTEAKAALVAMAMEAAELQEAVGGSVTDAVAGWLAPQYALTAREQLAELKGEDRLKLLRSFVHDWALLRHGDQTAERLRIEREWLALEERAYLQRFKRKTVAAMETFYAYVQGHPKAKAAFEALIDEMRHPFDSNEEMPQWDDRDEPIRPNPTESDR